VDRRTAPPRLETKRTAQPAGLAVLFHRLGQATMTTKTLVMVSSTIEAATGLALIVDPGLVVRILLGTGLFGGGIAVSRVAGVALLALGLACWPSEDDATAHTTWALFTYNFLAAIYLGYLRTGGGFVSHVLWPVCALHALLALLLARPAYTKISAVRAVRSR
jgi:hypothetical protein